MIEPLKYRDVRDIDSFDYPGGYQAGVDSVLQYIGCLHPETTLKDVLSSVQDAIEKGVI